MLAKQPWSIDLLETKLHHKIFRIQSEWNFLRDSLTLMILRSEFKFTSGTLLAKKDSNLSLHSNINDFKNVIN